jgi:Raf kinase inhibitor-like YbhB/YbcL family protein
MSIRRSLRTLACVFALAPCLSCGRETGAAMTNASQGAEPRATETHTTSSMQLHSPDFRADGALPARFTCDGDSVSPALQWSNAPAGTRSLALVVDDPDAPDPAAPQRTWVHWVLYDLPADSTGLPQGARAEQLPAGTRQGRNDWDRSGFGAPCPPKGRHRYVHTLYALDAVLPDLHEPDKAQLLARMKGHVIATARLIGTYERGAR